MSNQEAAIRTLVDEMKKARDDLALTAARLETVPDVLARRRLAASKVDRLLGLVEELRRVTDGRYRVNDELFMSIVALRASVDDLCRVCSGKGAIQFREEAERVGLGIDRVLIPR